MIKLDSNLPLLTLAPAPALDVSTLAVVSTNRKPGRRLIVLIPGIEVDYAPIMPRVWELAHALECRVLFLGLSRDVSEEPGLRRALVTMSALIQDSWVSAEAKTEIGNNWVKVVESHWQAGDLIVCFADQRTGWLQKPLGQILESRLKATVYILSELVAPSPRRADWLSLVSLWGGFAVIVIGFFCLQVNLDQALAGWVQTTMLVLTVLAEFWLLWVWNNLSS